MISKALPCSVCALFLVLLSVAAQAAEGSSENAIPANAELQLGKHFSQKFSAFADMLVGLGSDRPYDWGLGVGLRFKY